MLCCVACHCGRGVCLVCGVCVCLCVFCGTPKKKRKTRVWIQKRLRVYIRNVPVYAGTTRTCVSIHTRGGRRQFCLPRQAHVEFSLGPREVHQRSRWIRHIFSLRTDREQHVPDSSNHSLYLTKLFSFRSLEGNFGGNQQPDGSISLLPSHLHNHHNNTQDTETETHTDRDTDTDTETEPKFRKRFARQTLSKMFG